MECYLSCSICGRKALDSSGRRGKSAWTIYFFTHNCVRPMYIFSMRRHKRQNVELIKRMHQWSVPGSLFSSPAESLGTRLGSPSPFLSSCAREAGTRLAIDLVYTTFFIVDYNRVLHNTRATSVRSSYNVIVQCSILRQFYLDYRMYH